MFPVSGERNSASLLIAPSARVEFLTVYVAA